MNRYCLCRRCTRHVKRGEASCPFCGETPLVDSRGGARVLRAPWLACGSALTALRCTSSAPAQPPQSQDATAASVMDGRGADSAKVEVDQGAATADEASTDDATTVEDARAEGAEPMFASADGSFPCSWAFNGGTWDGATCDRATQYCFLQGGIGYSPDGCRLFDCGPNSPSDAGCGPIAWDAAACDGGVRRCACLATPCSARTCSDDDGGGIVLSCGQCYGAPPARRSPRDERAWRLAV